MYSFTTESGSGNNPPNFWVPSPVNGATDVPIDTSSISLVIGDPDNDRFDWTIETVPYVGSSSGSDEVNGRKVCVVSGLSYSTTYQWFVNATDGELWRRSVYSFTTEGSQGGDPEGGDPGGGEQPPEEDVFPEEENISVENAPPLVPLEPSGPAMIECSVEYYFSNNSGAMSENWLAKCTVNPSRM